MELSSSNIKKFLILPEMELFSSKIKKCLIFLEINFSYISERNFQTSKNSPRKNFLIFWKMELSGSNIKKFLIFSQKKSFFIFRETKTLKKLFMSQETGLFYIPGNANPKNELHFKKSNEKKMLKKWKKATLKKCHIFWEIELSSPKLKKLLIFQEETCKAWKIEISYIPFTLFLRWETTF